MTKSTERFEWDRIKEAENIRKHGISFATAETVFDDPMILIREDFELSEERFQAIGRAGDSSVLLVIHTVSYANKDTTITRIISARAATRQEGRIYGSPRTGTWQAAF